MQPLGDGTAEAGVDNPANFIPEETVTLPTDEKPVVDEGLWGWGTQDDMMRGGLWGAGGGALGGMMLPEDREEEEEYESSGTPPWQGRVQLGGFSGISPGGRERRYFGRV